MIMPYSKEHKESTREKILKSAILLFSAGGFDQVSIDDLMKHAGLTRGAFYSHFESKQDVYSKAIIAGAKNSQFNTIKPEGMNEDHWLRELVFTYLSPEHINQDFSPCPLAFLVTDIANNESKVKSTYARVYKRLNKGIQIKLDYPKIGTKTNSATEEDILAATAMMIGGVAIGRTLEDEGQRNKLLDSCRKGAIDLLKINPK